VSDDVEVVATADGVELRRSGTTRGVRLDMEDVARRIRQGRKLALTRACGARPGLVVLDAMAGLGADAVVLAAMGCDVTAVEAAPKIHRVLVDGVERACVHLEGRVRCVLGDALATLALDATWDVVYLDPMFPTRHKGALPKLKAQVLADAAHPLAVAEADLLDRAICRAVDRVVLKRRARDPEIRRPDWRIEGRSVRFDVYRGSASRGAISGSPPARSTE